ncbi:hypothetical protein Dsin_000916 [Dipteronia sinensis]|uniref:Lunapark zinc ribbon domain-containing protein n=1 Tax=Dipteronia sinensis TaxID=43782 RepID=A0AAE0B487_9ROSI|nr:hypothetical protein Dsin_000916 [Dipteronia sinensis]
MAEDRGITEGEKGDSGPPPPPPVAVKKKQKGFVSRIWNGIFSRRGDDFEKRLQYIFKEEALVLARIKRRTITLKRVTWHLVTFSLVFEVIAIGYAIMTTRSVDLDWKMRAFRVLPMFLLPCLSFGVYSAFMRFSKMRDRKDHKTLERLREERQAKIDELKEKTNYYTTQQLIQRYDPDPAAKAAAASVLASKLGADTGMKVYLGDESKLNNPTGKSNDAEVVPSSNLRNRKHTRSSSLGSMPLLSEEDASQPIESASPQSDQNHLVVNHHYPDGSTMHDGGWIARIAALLVGDDPTQSYALICGNCHMHNGLARKEDFLYITYYCPHCHALNAPKQSEEHVAGPNSSSPTVKSLTTGGRGVPIPNSPSTSTLATEGNGDQTPNSPNTSTLATEDNASDNTVSENVKPSDSPVKGGSEIVEEVEKEGIYKLGDQVDIR